MRIPRMTLPTLPKRRGPATEVDTPMPTPPDGATIAPPEPVNAAIHGHLLTRRYGNVDDGLWAYYVLAPQDQMFISPHDRERTYGSQIFRLRSLVGRRIWWRGTLSPSPVSAYGEAMMRAADGMSPARAAAYADMIGAAQKVMIGYDAMNPVCTLGVQITKRYIEPEHLQLVAGSGPIQNDLSFLNDVRRELGQVTVAVRREGFMARPINGPGLMWLTHASRGMGCPTPPLVLDSNATARAWESVDGFSDGLYATAGEFSPTVHVSALRSLAQYDAHVVVQPVEDFGPRDLEDHSVLPWLGWVLGQNEPGIGPVEYVVLGEIVAGEDLIQTAGLDRKRAESTREDWEQHNETPPPAIGRGIHLAAKIEDEVTTAPPEIAARFQGVVLLATSGPTVGDALDRAEQLRLHAAREQKLTLAHDVKAQYALYRAFAPGARETGDPAVIEGYVTRMPLYYLASAIPNGFAPSGDRVGMPVGPIGGATDFYVYDPHGAPARNVSGLTAILGKQGAGKSSFAGAAIYWSSLSGHRNVFTDPAGMMRRLCELPELKDDSYVFDMSKARPGVAVPSLLIPDPSRRDYPNEMAYERAMAEAKLSRVDATLDVFRELLPYPIVMSEQGAYLMSAIESVVAEHGSEYGSNPWYLLEQMEKDSDYGRQAARLLRARGEGSVFFPDRGQNVDDRDLRARFERATLTGISMEGIAVPPPGLPRPMWTRDQMRSAPLLLVASLLAMRVMYADRNPKLLTLDELGILASHGQGASPLIVRSGTESRKWGATVHVVGQNPTMFTSLGDEISNLLGAAFIGQMEPKTARACLPLLGLAEDSGHDYTIASLERGEFLVSRTTGQGAIPAVRRTYMDRGWWNERLWAALDTTPTTQTRLDETADLSDLLVVTT